MPHHGSAAFAAEYFAAEQVGFNGFVLGVQFIVAHLFPYCREELLGNDSRHSAGDSNDIFLRFRCVIISQSVDLADGTVENIYASVLFIAQDVMQACRCKVFALFRFVTIDFESTQEPVIQKVDYDFAASGHSLCIVDTGGNHSDLTDDYAAIRSEMEAVAHAMGKSVLRQVAYEDFFAALPELQTKVNDRALIRAIHFYNDNRRVEDAVSCLEQGNFDGFLADINASGRSSFMYNQNVFTTKNPTDQRLSLALAISGQVLGDRGAYRVHGGGFAGTIQAFVPNDLLEQYRTVLEGVFGEGTCHVLQVRPVGGACLA